MSELLRQRIKHCWGHNLQQNGRRKSYELLRSQLENERSTFLPHWRSLSDYLLPRRSRFTITDVNKGDRRNQNIIDNTATLAARTLRSGMMSGVTSPARPWFRLTTPDPDMANFGTVKEWLYDVTKRMETVFIRSNIYNALPVIYGDIGVFATAAMSLEEDFDGDVIRCYPFPIGSYMIANDHKLKVNVFFREFSMTVRQIVSRFGELTEGGQANWDNMSHHVKNLWEQGQTEAWVNVCHVISPNDEYDESKLESKYKKYRSVYYERGYGSSTTQGYSVDDNRILSDKGYNYFPILCPRWEVTGEDVYGTDCPGMTALGDVKALQLMHRRKAKAVDKMIDPPMTAPSSMKNQKASLLPADITYIDTREGQQGFRPTHEVRPNIQELLLDIQSHQGRIQRAFYEDLFLMLANSDRREITAREIDERHEEKLLALGPVLEQLNQDLLDPLIDNTFEIMLQQGLIPPPPEELQGMQLKVEYISVMAQAQKLVGIGGIERFTGFAGQVAQVNPSILDKVNADKLIEIHGDYNSIPPGIVRTDDEVAAIRDQRAQQQQAQAQAERIKMLTSGAKDLAGADMSGDNALTRVIDQANAGALTPQ